MYGGQPGVAAGNDASGLKLDDTWPHGVHLKASCLESGGAACTLLGRGNKHPFALKARKNGLLSVQETSGFNAPFFSCALGGFAVTGRVT